MKVHVSGRARPVVLFVVASVLGCWGAFASEKAVTMLSGENWWGLCSNFGRQMPFNAKSDFKCDLRVSNYSHQSQSVLVSDKGRVLYCDAPVEATIGGGTIKFVSDRGEIILTEDAGKTLAEAFRFASKTYFPPTGEEPELLYFSAPQYNTWIELTYHQNEKDILAYAQSMLDHGLPPGIFMIDDTWQLDYGTWEFDLRRFSDPKGMVAKLHKMGFKEPLTFRPEDSSSPAAPVRWIASDGEAVFAGGGRLGGWRDDGDGTWSAPVPKDAAGRPIWFQSLYVNGRRAVRARHPNTGYFHVDAWHQTAVTNVDGEVSYRQVSVVSNAAANVLAGLSARELAAVELQAVVKWSYGAFSVTGWDPAARKLTVDSRRRGA